MSRVAEIGTAIAALLITWFVVVKWPTTNPYVLYARYVCRHKWFVLLYAATLGITWRGLTHDLSKFRPSEFIPYARYFYGRDRGTTAVRDAFEQAWRWHYTRNPHHWEHWVVPRIGRSGVVARAQHTFAIAGPPIGIEEPRDADIREMLADWLAMPQTNHDPGDPLESTRTFYIAHRDEMILSVRARRYVEQELAIPPVRETGWRDAQVVLDSQLHPTVALRMNQAVVAPGGRRGVFIGWRRGKCLVRLERTGLLLHVYEKDLQRA